MLPYEGACDLCHRGMPCIEIAQIEASQLKGQQLRGCRGLR